MLRINIGVKKYKRSTFKPNVLYIYEGGGMGEGKEMQGWMERKE